MKYIYLFIIVISSLLYSCQQNKEEITNNRFSESESYNIINSIYNNANYKDTIYLLSRPVNSNYFEDTVMCFPVFPLKYLTFYNIDEYRNEGAFISKTWDDNLLSNSIHLINDSIKLNSALNPYSNKLVYAISLPLRDKSGNFALLFEEIYYYNIYKIEKYRIFKKYPNEWKLFYEIEK